MVKSSNRQSAKNVARKANPSSVKKGRAVVEHEPATDEIAAIPEARESIVTPSGARSSGAADDDDDKKVSAQRALFRDKSTEAPVPAVTPARPGLQHDKKETSVKRKLLFGRYVNEVTVRNNVRQVYSVVRKLTGSIGGNGSSGPIYGELTMGSMQKVVNAMVEHTAFDRNSRFIDVGSGIGKPNLHVAQDPGCEFSYGIEVEHDRWMLGMSCLNGVLEAARKQTAEGLDAIQYRCMFECGDISAAQSFDPFTHVYMFSCGFPPTLWSYLSDMWNRSSSSYMICYSGPRHMIDDYEFQLELITQLPTSMHGSKEGHMAYLYRRPVLAPLTQPDACDPLFQSAWDLVKTNNLELLQSHVRERLAEAMETKSGRATRSRRSRRL